jgi:hypothetical protein
MANHNLNVEISIAGLNMLIPNTIELNKTNGVNGSGSLGAMAQQCTGKNIPEEAHWRHGLTVLHREV